MKIPPINYNPSKKAMAAIYSKAIKELAEYLTDSLTVESAMTPEMIDQTAIFRQLNFRIKQLDSEMETEVKKMIAESFKDGRLRYYLEIGDAKTMQEAARLSQFTTLNTGLIDSIVMDTMENLLVATTHMEQRLKRIVRNAVADRVRLGVALDRGWRDISDDLFNKLSKEGFSKTLVTDGFVGIVDSRGRRWKLKTYSDMVTQTKIMEASIDGSRNEGLQEGVDLAVISRHGAKDACGKWEDVIISMNGLTAGYPTYQQVKESKECFHPHCQHHLKPVRSLELLSDRTKRVSKQKMKENWKTLKEI